MHWLHVGVYLRYRRCLPERLASTWRTSIPPIAKCRRVSLRPNASRAVPAQPRSRETRTSSCPFVLSICSPSERTDAQTREPSPFPLPSRDVPLTRCRRRREFADSRSTQARYSPTSESPSRGQVKWTTIHLPFPLPRVVVRQKPQLARNISNQDESSLLCVGPMPFRMCSS